MNLHHLARDKPRSDFVFSPSSLSISVSLFMVCTEYLVMCVLFLRYRDNFSGIITEKEKKYKYPAPARFLAGAGAGTGGEKSGRIWPEPEPDLRSFHSTNRYVSPLIMSGLTDS